MPDKKIFIVEDESIVAMALEASLKQMGYTVAGKALSGTEAIRGVGETGPDLILMDISLQGRMDGIETAAKITELYRIPVVYLTAHSDEKTLERAMQTQPHGYLIKPFRQRELYSTIEIALYKNRLVQRGAAPPQAPLPQESIGRQEPGKGPDRLQEKPVEPPPAPSFGITLQQAVLDVIGLPVFILNRDMKLVYFNTPLADLFGKLGYLHASSGNSLFDIASATLVGTQREYQDVLESGRQSQTRVTLVVEDAEVTFLVHRISLAEPGGARYIAVVIRDVSRDRSHDDRIRKIAEHHDMLLSHLGSITKITSESKDPLMKEIATHVSEMVIEIARLAK
jgi:DNA-binding NarL/FixJ family response regulator